MIAGSVYVIEHKTSSSDIEDGAPYWKRLRLDSQASTYMVGARSLLGIDPAGVLYDVLRKPRIKPLKATPVEQRKYTKPTKAEPTPRLYANQRETDETLDEYRARLREDIEASPDAYYKRGVVVRTSDEEREAAHDAWDVASLIASSQRSGRWPRNVDACERYGRWCDFFPVCTGEASVTDAMRYRRSDKSHEELDGKHRLPLVTTSAMKCYRRCAREYQYSYELGYRSLEKADALAFGTLVHVGLETWWRTVDFDAAVSDMRASTTNELHLVQAEELLRGYHARWCEERFDVLAVEREFVAPLVDPATGVASSTWELGGKIDAIARVSA